MEHELFMESPLPDDRRPREEVVATYLQHCRAPDDERFQWAGTTMTGMTFYANDYQQWGMILELVERAPDDDHVLQDIAAGPLEGFLGRFDGQVIDRVEQQALRDEKFSRVLTGVWRHRMSDATWNRIRNLQRKVRNPLSNMVPFDT